MTNTQMPDTLTNAHNEPDQFSADGPFPATRRLLLPFLLAGLLGLWIIFVQVLPKDPFLYAQLTEPFRPNEQALIRQQLRSLREKDPALGSRLPLPNVETILQSPGSVADAQVSNHRLISVLMIGSCSSCVLSTLQAANELQNRDPRIRVVVVSPSPELLLRRFRQAHHLKLEMVSDLKGTLAERYNAAWTPRAYLLSPTGSLLWSQTAGRFDAGEVERAIASGGTR